MGEIVGMDGAPIKEKQEDAPRDLVGDDLAMMADHFVRTMSDLGLSCVVIITGVLDSKLRRIYQTNIQNKADRVTLFETLTTMENSTGIEMPARHPIVGGG